MAMDKEKLLAYFQDHYLSRQEVLFKLPLNYSIESFWPELLQRRKAQATVLPLYNALGMPYWYVLTPKMVSASERLCEEAINQEKVFDPYNNVDPETLMEWEEEFRRENLRDMRSYLKRFPDATPEEKKALRSWVRKGRSPYENGWYIADESGGPMDFINARRFLEYEYQEFLKDPEGYRGCPDEQPENGNPHSGSSADDLPF